MVRTRFAPSPTGELHIGGLRSALYAYALAKHSDGSFILRIEDTDQKRKVEGATERIYGILETFGLIWDEGPKKGGLHSPYVQSERVGLGVYRDRADELLGKGLAYYCFCAPEIRKEVKPKEGRGIPALRDPCREVDRSLAENRIKKGELAAVRLKVPSGIRVGFYDEVAKREVFWDSDHLDDAMLLKSDGFPTYHLAVVTDDLDMKITHVLRGHDWLSSTPVHLLIYRFLEKNPPKFFHLSDILDPGGGKLSKRKGAFSCEQLLRQGYLPEAIINFVMLLGWAPKNNRELFSLSEFIEVFDVEGLQKSNPAFNQDKLDWFNGIYIRKKSDAELAELIDKLVGDRIKGGVRTIKIVPLIRDRVSKLSDFDSLAGFFYEAPPLQKEGFSRLGMSHLNSAMKIVSTTAFDVESLGAGFKSEINNNKYKTGDFFMDLRLAITGKKITPPITESIALLGVEETKKRLMRAMESF